MKKLKRKLNKLKRHPKLFFSDMMIKYSNKLKRYIPTQYQGQYQYTVVSAVYNVEKYLDEYFTSLIQQTLNFKKSIRLILVDDGSTDTSAQIIKKWQKKYPENIHYIYKENGGQASARNLGLQFVKTEWVTFIDPDDFVSKQYFQEIDKFIYNNQQIMLVSCAFIFYFEDKKIFKDSHPLRYRFNNGNTVLPLNKMQKHIQMSVNSACFRTEIIKRNHILFPEIKPNFEDAKFVGDYLVSINQNDSVAFISESKYFYRKRSDNSSTLDGSWKKKTLFTQVLDEGCLKLLENTNNTLGYVPMYIQNSVLYHLSWYFKYLVNNNAALSILTDDEKKFFCSILYKIFSFIDKETIMEFNLAGTWFFQRVSWLGYFKNQKPPFQIVYIDNIDREKKQFLLYYFTCDKEPKEDITLAGKKLNPIYEKTRVYNFINTDFVYERRFWLPYDENQPKQMFRFKVDGKDARISLIGKQHRDGLPIFCLLRDFTPKNYPNTDNSWIIMDRDTQADDNGEHLYRYIMNKHPEQKIYFALNRKSCHWDRLKSEGFNLLDFNSEKYNNQLKKSSKLISSHIDEYIVNPFKDNFEFSKKIVFLQHGVTHNDLSSWLNSKRTLQCLITATHDEYKAISGDKTKYKFTEKEVVLTGFPRHDALLIGNDTNSQIILIMPTWRKNILGSIVEGSNKRELNKDFMETTYAKHWKNFLCSNALKTLTDKFGYTVIFAPHANIEPYLDLFDLPNYIQLWRASDSSIQALFQKSKFMITDYSSVAFEMGFLNKTVLYYQFDHEEFFNGTHAFQAGYFSYEKHGFGPVVYNEKDLITALKRILKNKGNPYYPYDKRIRKTFAFRDGKNCERVYQAINNLDTE